MDRLEIRDWLLKLRYHTEQNLWARTALTVGRRLPGLNLVARGLGRISPLLNLALAATDIWLAWEDAEKAWRRPDINSVFRAIMSALLATCSVVCMLNIPVISQVFAVLALVIDFLKQLGLKEISPAAPETAPAI